MSAVSARAEAALLSTGDGAPTAPVGALRSRFAMLGSRRALVCGVVLVAGPLLVATIARMFVNKSGMEVFAYTPSLSPSASHPFGTDTAGRDVLASLVYGALPTYEIGLIGGGAATVVGTLVGMVGAYFGGFVDTLLRGVADVFIGIPPIAILIVVTALYNVSSVEVLGLLLAATTWPLAARGIRSQVLSLRQRPFVVMARLSNRSAVGIMFGELFPNMSALVMAGLVGNVFGALLTAIGLQLLGLGPTTVPSWGLMLQNAISGGAMSQGLWWWWAAPAALLIVLFMGLFSFTVAMDTVMNPQLRRDAARG